MDSYPKLINLIDKSVIYINNSSFSLGRSLSCDHTIESINVSRFHCTIKRSNDNKWFLFDQSTNGTEVDGLTYKFNKFIELKEGSIIKLAPEQKFVFNHGNTDCTDTPPVVNLCDITTSSSRLEMGEVQEQIGTQNDPKPNAQVDEQPKKSDDTDESDSEWTCSICSELFIKAMTLTCSHTFCKYCIDEWRKKKSNCPICRTNIVSISPTLVIDNFIAKIVERQSSETIATRSELIKQRESEGNQAGCSTSGSSNQLVATRGHVIEISEDDEDSEEDMDETSDYDNDYYDHFDNDSYRTDSDIDNDDDGDSDYNGLPGVYYGGYGSCFNCGQTGHWSNGCPKRRRPQS